MNDPWFFIATWFIVSGFAFFTWLAVDSFVDNMARARRERRQRLTVLDVLHNEADR